MQTQTSQSLLGKRVRAETSSQPIDTETIKSTAAHCTHSATSAA